MGSKRKTVVIKISGEALADEKDQTIFDKEKLERVADAVKELHDKKINIALVVGGGNIWRGRLAAKVGIEQSTGDYMGMLGTIINALALQSACEEKGLSVRVMSAINVPQVCEPYYRRKAIHHLEKERVIIFAGGTGNPYFTTDSTATLRALDIGAEEILMGKNGVDGVYDSDPRKNPNAKFLHHLTFREVVERQLGVMDLTAVAMLENSDIRIRVFDMDDPKAIVKVLDDDSIGSIIEKE